MIQLVLITWLEILLLQAVGLVLLQPPALAQLQVSISFTFFRDWFFHVSMYLWLLFLPVIPKSRICLFVTFFCKRFYYKGCLFKMKAFNTNRIFSVTKQLVMIAYSSQQFICFKYKIWKLHYQVFYPLPVIMTLKRDQPHSRHA